MNDERARLQDAALLLKDAAILYERHGAGRPEPFNVFTAMFDDKDEVRLHSRFLAALLGHRKPGEERAANLHDFIKEFASKPLPNFAPDGAKVERERWHIDILITNNRGQALAIENKICAGDQNRQLERYHEELRERGYNDRHILYLTINGRKPSEESIGGLGKKDYTPISYERILGWLKRCRKRAYDEPELRDTVAQYSRLIEKLTKGSELMNELKDLCLRDNNLLVAHHLAEALTHAKASLMHEMWEKIREILEKDSFTDLIEKISEDSIRESIENKTGRYFGLYYSFGQDPAYLAVEAGGYGFIVGVWCDKSKEKYKEKYKEIKSTLEKQLGRGEKPDDAWPWWCVLRPDGTGLNSGDIETLADKKARNELTDEVAKLAVEKLIAIRNRVQT